MGASNTQHIKHIRICGTENDFSPSYLGHAGHVLKHGLIDSVGDADDVDLGAEAAQVLCVGDGEALVSVWHAVRDDDGDVLCIVSEEERKYIFQKQNIQHGCCKDSRSNVGTL